MDFQIFDCTLRDGGYYTSWDFEESLVEIYLDGVAKLPVTSIEVGYCNLPQSGYRGEWFYLRKKRLEWARSRLRDDQQLAIMLDAKNCTVEMLPSLVGDLTDTLQMVRMAVSPDQFEHGLELAKGLKGMGFRVGFNTMYLSAYSPELDELGMLADNSELIDTLALVDSYGGCSPSMVGNAIRRAGQMFGPLPIGFHGHDNTCMAYANALAAVDNGASVVDGTFLGMGRGAGNTRTEMLMVHQSGQGVVVDFDAVAQIVDCFTVLQERYKWGTSLPYMLSGASNLPQKDVMDWLGKNRYSPISVVRALQNQNDGAIDNKVYTNLQPGDLPASARGNVLILGGGPSVLRHLPAIRDFCSRSGVLVIHSHTRHMNLIGQVGEHELVCLPGDAMHALPSDFDPVSVAGFVVPRPPRFKNAVPVKLPCPVFQASTFLSSGSDHIGPISDIGPLALGVGAAMELGADTIYIVGFDGYANASAAEQELGREIQSTMDLLAAHEGSKIVSLTPTLYDVPQCSVYAEATGLNDE